VIARRVSQDIIQPRESTVTTPPPTLNSYADVQQYLSNLVATLGSNIGGAPHGAFWKTLTYKQFTTGNVPGGKLVNQPPGDPPNPDGTWTILVVGKAPDSNIIKALQGVAPFDGSIFQQMPADGPPFASKDQIQPLADWINRNCPNG
jgi:hypothetical protein